MINKHLKITGRVQGVGFRWSIYQLAIQHGVAGIVRNQNDGSVYCELQGTATNVDQIIKEIKAGPTPYAAIASISIEKSELKNYQNSFRITR